MTITFQAHGIKTSKGVEKCRYMPSDLVDGRKAITIYSNATCCSTFSREIREVFQVENSTDSMTDYFEADMIRVFPEHPMFKDVLAGAVKQAQFGLKRCTKGGAYRYYSNRIAELQQLAA